MLRQSKKSKKKKSSGCCWERQTGLLRDLERAGGFPQYQPDFRFMLDIAVQKQWLGARCSRVVSGWWSSPQRSLLDPYRGRIIRTVAVAPSRSGHHKVSGTGMESQSATFLRNEQRTKLPGSTGRNSTVSLSLSNIFQLSNKSSEHSCEAHWIQPLDILLLSGTDFGLKKRGDELRQLRVEHGSYTFFVAIWRRRT